MLRHLKKCYNRASESQAEGLKHVGRKTIRSRLFAKYGKKFANTPRLHIEFSSGLTSGEVVLTDMLLRPVMLTSLETVNYIIEA